MLFKLNCVLKKHYFHQSAHKATDVCEHYKFVIYGIGFIFSSPILVHEFLLLRQNKYLKAIRMLTKLSLINSKYCSCSTITS